MQILYEVPEVREYVQLRIAAGLGTKNEFLADKVLSRSLFTVIARDEHSELIGMGRIIGDGGTIIKWSMLRSIPLARLKG